MKRGRGLILWVAAGVAGIVLLAALFSRAFPFLPRHWTISRDEAVAIGLERLRDLGEPVRDPYVVVSLDTNSTLERRLDALPGGAESALRQEVVCWQVVVYPRGALRDDWSYLARVSLSGDLLTLRMRLELPEQAAPSPSPLTPQAARDRADTFLVSQGVDLARYDPPILRGEQVAARTDLRVRYRDRSATPGGITHGVQVVFAGDRLEGFEPWIEDPRQRELQQALQSLQFVTFGRLILTMFVMLLLAFPFLKRYHEGEIGVRRGAQILLLVALSALLFVLLVARSASQEDSFGFANREQTTWIAGLGAMMFQILPTCLLAFFAWSVGESVCRERWGPKLAAFDALFHGEWSNATVARSALRGAAAGCALAGAFVALLVALRHLGASPLVTVILPGSGNWPGLGVAARWLAESLSGFLAVMLCLVPMVSQRLGRAAGALAGVLLGGALLFPSLVAVPFVWGMAASLAFAVVPVLLFLAYDLLTVLMAGAVAEALLFSWPLLISDDASLRVNGALGLVILASPLLASVAALRSRREFVYRYQDIPPHVRRIAERERQRVELKPPAASRARSCPTCRRVSRGWRSLTPISRPRRWEAISTTCWRSKTAAWQWPWAMWPATVCRADW